MAFFILGNLMFFGVNYRYLINTGAGCGAKPVLFDWLEQFKSCELQVKVNLSLHRTLLVNCFMAVVWGLRFACPLTFPTKSVEEVCKKSMAQIQSWMCHTISAIDAEKKVVCVTCLPLFVLSVYHHVPWARWLAFSGFMFSWTQDAKKDVLARSKRAFTLLTKAQCSKQPMVTNAVTLLVLAVIVSSATDSHLSFFTDAWVDQINRDIRFWVCPDTIIEEKGYFNRSGLTMTLDVTADLLVRPYIGVPAMIVRTHVRRYMWDNATLSAWYNLVLFCFFMTTLLLSDNRTDMFAALGKLAAGIGKFVEWLWEAIQCCGQVIKTLIAFLVTVGLGSLGFQLWVSYTIGENVMTFMVWGISGFLWCVHWMCYFCAFVHWIDNSDKLSILMATGAAWFAFIMLRHNAYLLVFWMCVLVTQDGKHGWCPRAFVEAFTYWTRLCVLFCCAMQLTDTPFECIGKWVYEVLTTGWC